MRPLKYSRQRESIKEFLNSRTDHPTAITVYHNLQKIYPNISLGTVYRNLSLLTELGEINRISTEEGGDRFDAVTTPHNHFYCRKCHRLSDMKMENVDHVMLDATKDFSGKIESYTTLFQGICQDCLDKTKEETKASTSEIKKKSS